MAARFRLPTLGPRMRKVARIAGYVFLALFTFVFALQLTFPYDRVRSKIEEALAEKYQVSIGEVERGWVPGRVYFKSVSLQTRPTKPDEQATSIFIDKLGVDVDFLPFLHGAASVNLTSDLAGGHLRGNVTISKDGTSISFSGANLQTQFLPMRDVVGLPMFGALDLDVSLDLPNDTQKSGKRAPNWQKAEGEVRVACPTGCTFGDGKTKLKTKLKNARNQAFAADGIEFGKVSVKSLLAKVEIKTGQLTVTQFEAPSDDGTLHVEYAMELQPTLDDSNVTGCLRFNGSPSLLQREPKTFSAITATGAPLGPDGLFHIRLTDKLKDMKRLGQVCGSAVSGKSMDNPAGRPVLTVQPDEAAKPDGGIAPNFPPPAQFGSNAGVGAPGAGSAPTPVPEAGSSGHGPEGSVQPPAGSGGGGPAEPGR